MPRFLLIIFYLTIAMFTKAGSQGSDSFHFNQLPKELRFEIWDIFLHQPRLLFIQPAASTAEVRWLWQRCWKIFDPTPVLLRVNHESRRRALTAYRLLFPPSKLPNAYINPDLDVVYVLTPPTELPTRQMWQMIGDMQTAIGSLCTEPWDPFFYPIYRNKSPEPAMLREFTATTSLAIDFQHLFHGIDASDLSNQIRYPEYADRWVRRLSQFPTLRTLTFIRGGDKMSRSSTRSMAALVRDESINRLLDAFVQELRKEYLRVSGAEDALRVLHGGVQPSLPSISILKLL
jgi:hypothetical protein